MTEAPDRFTGRCYCGGIARSAQEPPQTVAYCHCTDCRRITSRGFRRLCGERGTCVSDLARAQILHPRRDALALPRLRLAVRRRLRLPAGAALHPPRPHRPGGRAARRNSTPTTGTACPGSISRTASPHRRHVSDRPEQRCRRRGVAGRIFARNPRTVPAVMKRGLPEQCRGDIGKLHFQRTRIGRAMRPKA